MSITFNLPGCLIASTGEGWHGIGAYSLRPFHRTDLPLTVLAFVFHVVDTLHPEQHLAGGLVGIHHINKPFAGCRVSIYFDDRMDYKISLLTAVSGFNGFK